ncbi:hypothetical protein EDB92DRAFT_1942487 [Lactarius akahatsu]|uniref:BTB domain-containing protein n=1 Tax=Lactarius akahatsu TaxID=416441 RepID=A0AAD4LNH9_9AGAM|nr:hypothetical protein EDB92DRAFT_1942487 [Lactarius akahatsu]
MDEQRLTLLVVPHNVILTVVPIPANGVTKPTPPPPALVDGSFYCVHRFLFSRDSVHISARLGTRDHEALTPVVSPGDVEREIFEALLSVIYPKDFEEHNASYQQWKSLAMRQGFASIRKLAKFINPPTPHDWLMLARINAVGQWILGFDCAVRESSASQSDSGLPDAY